jgi:RNA polymerase sigma-70 factor (ECF subfamily)
MDTQAQTSTSESLAAVRAGDREAFMALLERHLDGLYRFVVREVRYHEALGNFRPGEVLPEEIVDEVALRALRRAPRIPRQATFRGWLRLLALRAIDDRVRRLRRQHKLEAVSLEEPLRSGQRGDEYFQPDYALKWEDVLPAPVLSPEQEVMLRETWQELERALNELPLEQRLAFVLHAIEGLGYAEIATITHRTRSEVKAAYHAAREALRQRFVEQFQPIGDLSERTALNNTPTQ